MRALGFGAIVWDDIGPTMNLGGAVLNLLSHLGRLGGQAEMVSALGTDALGDQSVEAVGQQGVGLRWTRRVQAPTCLVRVEFDERHEPAYRLDDDVSWDHIALAEGDVAAIQAEHFDVFCFGTIEQRAGPSRDALRELVSGGGLGRLFCDVNLRPPFYSREVIEYSLRQADIVKVNTDEATELGGMFDLATNDPETMAGHLRRRFDIDQLLVTDGAAGAYYSSEEGYGFCPAYPVAVADTVGAGDAFSAGLLHGLHRGDTLESACGLACRLGALVASKVSSLPDYSMGEVHSLTREESP